MGAIEARFAREVPWRQMERDDDLLRYRVGFSLASWGEVVTIEVGPDGIEIESRCAMRVQFVDWGKNPLNVHRASGVVERAVRALERGDATGVGGRDVLREYEAEHRTTDGPRNDDGDPYRAPEAFDVPLEEVDESQWKTPTRRLLATWLGFGGFPVLLVVIGSAIGGEAMLAFTMFAGAAAMLCGPICWAYLRAWWKRVSLPGRAHSAQQIALLVTGSLFLVVNAVSVIVALLNDPDL